MSASPSTSPAPSRSPQLARRSRPTPGHLAVERVVAAGAFSPDPPPTRAAWLTDSPVPLWLPTTLAAALVLQWTLMAAIAIGG